MSDSAGLTTILDLAPFATFDQAANAVVKQLHEMFPYSLWMVTRTVKNDWIVLSANDHSYGVDDRTVFTWTDSFCSRMVRGEGPRVAPRSKEIPAYVEAPIGQQVPIEAYIGIPLVLDDGTLFGTLCAVDPSPQNTDADKSQPILELYGKLLSTIVSLELKKVDEERQIERYEQTSNVDSLTGLANAEAWKKALDREETRSRRYGSPLGIMVIEVDSDDENDILNASKALLRNVRRLDFVARVNDRELGVIALECFDEELETLCSNLETSLKEVGVVGSVGWSVRNPRSDIMDAYRLAGEHLVSAR